MNKKIILLILPVLVLSISLFTACEESEAPGKYENWKERNEDFMDSLENVYKSQAANLSMKDSLYRFQDPFAQQGYVYFKKLNPEKEEYFGRRPYYTEKVSVYYQGYFIDGDRFDGNFEGDEPEDFYSPSVFTINSAGLSSGFAWALQYMHVGERWMVYMPWRSTVYGSVGEGVIPGYSTLIFDMFIEKIVK